MDLLTCLQASPYRHLTAISCSLGLSCNTRTPKADFVHQLRDHLANVTALQRTHEDLSAKEQDALHCLVARNGRMPLHDFTRAFGAIRPYRPWRDEGPTHPWRHPISITEKLLYKGLIYLIPSDPQRRQPRCVILPTEILALVSPDNSPDGAKPAPLIPCSSVPWLSPFDPLLDLALFLAYLQQADVRPLHDRWLSPRHLWALGPCLSPPYPCQGARSELQADRIAFTHYLAESLGLVVSANHQLKPAPSALSWLSQPRSTQLQALWAAWLSPTDENRERWTRYRLPGQNLHHPPGFAQRLARLLTAFPPDVSLSLNELVQNPHLGLDELIPWWEQAQGDPAQHLLQQTLEGPLTWVGVVSTLSDQDSAIRNPKSEIGKWRLTSLGNWLLGHPEASPPEDASQSLTLVENLVLTLPKRPELPALLALAEWTEMSPGPQLCLTLASVTRALERGGDPQDLLAALARYAAPPLTPEQRNTLRSWVEKATPLTIQPCVLLEAVDSKQMDKLWDQRNIRSHMGRQLADKLATVQTADPERLIQVLRRNGLPVRSLLPNNGTGAGPLPPGDAFWLAVSFLIHAHLARRLSLTSVPPAAVLDHLTSFLDPAGLAAAQSAAAEAIARLHEALDGPAPLAPAITQDAILDRLETAIHGGEPLRIRYWSAWRGEITERVIQPEHIEWRGDHLYLAAHCHLRGAKRTFRLDRILKITTPNS